MMIKQRTLRKRIFITRQRGYILPAVIVLGLGVATIGVTALRAVTDGSTRLMSQYYDVLAKEAGQSGIAAVKACVASQPAAWAETAATQISSTRPLTPITDCDGNTDPAKSANTIMSIADYETTYKVVSIEKAPSSTTIYVTSVGEARIKSGSRVVSTFTETVRAMATSIKPASGPVSKDLSAVSVNGNTACAVTNAPDSWVYCWGSNNNLQLGTGRDETRSDGVTPPVGGSYSKPLAVAKNTGLLTAIGRSGCMNGSIVFGECFNILGGAYWKQQSVDSQPPSAMQGKKVVKVSVGQTHVCAVATDAVGANGKAYCWGKNNSGQLGNGLTTDSVVPVQVNDGATSALFNKTVLDVVAGNGFTCAKTSDNDVSCWGANGAGQLGTDSRTNSSIPMPISRHAFVAGIPSVCNSWWPGWLGGGCNGYTTAVPEKPASALIGEQIKSLADLKGQAATMCIITVSDKTVCWGENYVGQVGNGATLPAPVSGTSTVTNGADNMCPTVEPQARRNAVGQAESRANLRDYDVLRPSLVNTSLVFTSITINSSESEDMTYADVIGRTPTTASNNPDRLFNWGGAMNKSVTSNCINNSDRNNTDWSRATASASITFVGRSTPSTTPLYNLATNAPLNARLGLTAGNPVRGIFCATLLSMNQPYCDSHNGTANQGQLGNNYYCNAGWKPASPFGSYYDSCDNRWSTPQSVRQDIASDTSGPANPVNIGGGTVSSIDSSASGFTCMTVNASAWCWGIGGSGQIGDGSTSNRYVPTAVNYSDSAIRVNGTSGGDPASWVDPLWF